MIVQCPECNTKYRVSALLLGIKGREVRCGRCRNHWHQTATKQDIDDESADVELVFEEVRSNITVEELEEAISAPEEEAVEIVEPEPEEAVAGDDGADWRYIAASFAAFMFLTAAVFVLFPARVLYHFPETYPLYRALNILEAPAAVRPVTAEYQKMPDGEYGLYIELEAENGTAGTRPFAPLDIFLLGATGDVLKYWSVPGYGAEEGEDSSSLIRYGLSSAPPDGQRIVIRYDLYGFYGIPRAKPERSG